ncbi:uncharacterized protein LOC126854585 isoform X2 [Cataglyphis hispanica]|uniref:uncharacterized protein LOC126854585 isoform X2 n=1 Tax=Cataglyphis hispanica TaxID=1086592 RepID=UPI0021801A05|nr:uncharacterized protein LOC126854585 isoform X2 [Cataglyphis hispanica]
MAAISNMAALRDFDRWADDDDGSVAGPAAVTAAYVGDCPAVRDVVVLGDGVVMSAGGVLVDDEVAAEEVGGREDGRLRDDAPVCAAADDDAAGARVRALTSPPLALIVLCAPEVVARPGSSRGSSVCSFLK